MPPVAKLSQAHIILPLASAKCSSPLSILDVPAILKVHLYSMFEADAQGEKCESKVQPQSPPSCLFRDSFFCDYILTFQPVAFLRKVSQPLPILEHPNESSDLSDDLLLAHVLWARVTTRCGGCTPHSKSPSWLMIPGKHANLSCRGLTTACVIHTNVSTGS